MSSRHCVVTRVTKYYMSLILDTFFIFQIKILKQNTKKTATATKKNTDTRKTTEPHRRVHLLQIHSKCHLRTSAFVFPKKIGPLDPGVFKLHSKPTTRSLEQVKHPQIFRWKKPGSHFAPSAAPKPNLPGSSQLREWWFFCPRHTLLPPPISTEPSGGDTAPETKSRLKKLGQVSDSYHEYVSTICASKKNGLR